MGGTFYMEIGKTQGFFVNVYFDPEFEEILELTKSFDTLRIGLHKEKNQTHLVIASGYGATHSTLSHALGKLNPRLKPNKDGIKYQGLSGGSTILYEEDRRLWFNVEDWSMSDKEKPDKVLPFFGEPARSLMKEVIKQSIEQQHLLT